MDPSLHQIELNLYTAVSSLKSSSVSGVRLAGIGLLAYFWGQKNAWSVRDDVQHISELRDILISAKDHIESGAKDISEHFLDVIRSGDVHVVEDFSCISSGFQYIREVTHHYVMENVYSFETCFALYLRSGTPKVERREVPMGIPRTHTWWFQPLSPPTIRREERTPSRSK